MGERRNRELTEREFEVLKLVAAGYDNAEIGQALCIGKTTVRSHVNRMLVKFDADNRTHLVAIALTTHRLQADEIPRKVYHVLVDKHGYPCFG